MKKKLILAGVAFLFVLAALYLYIQTYWLQTTYYAALVAKPSGSMEGFRILQLSDLHSNTFGKNNSRLVKHIQSIDPDIIVMSGDMINAYGDDGAVVLELVRSLAGRYSIFYSIGNHEQLAEQHAREAGSDKYDRYIRSLGENGVVVLDNAKTEFTVGTGRINIYGFTLPVEYYTGRKVRKFLFETELEEENIFEALGTPDPAEINILLAHAPKYFAEYAAWGADLVFSGHVHGGLIRIPSLGGLLAPQQGFFPDYDGGKYTLDEKTMVVNRGKGSHILNLRVNNRPEITVVDLSGSSS